MDGHSPYFYKWKSLDGIRYYDRQNFSNLSFSNVTATPFFHQLLYPIANLPQRSLSKLWLVLEYLSVILMVVLALRMVSTQRNKIVVLLTALLFLFTNAWTRHVWLGQLYIFVPLLAMLFYYFLTRPHSLLNASLAGIFAVSIVLIRPTTVLFLLPFLLLIRRYSGKYLLSFFMSDLIILLLAFGSSSSRMYWSDYRKALSEHVKLHQDMELRLVKDEPDPEFPVWEGWDWEQVNKDSRSFRYVNDGENGNIFVLVKAGLNKKLPLWALYTSCLVFMAVFSLLFLRKYYEKKSMSVYTVALAGFCLYMASDIFAPIHRFNYNTTQWIFPLLLIASHRPSSFKKIYFAGIMAGFLLNSIPILFLPMQRTIGEYLVYACIVGSLLHTNPEPKS
jgi:hypothetical protein